MTTALLALALLAVKFQGPAQELLDLSEDEQWVLARGRRIVNCKAGNGKCAIPLLAVYNAATGKQAGMWEGEESSYINVARFLPGNGVQAAFTNLRTGTALLQWEWKAGTKPQITQLSSENMAPHCILDNTGGILISGDRFAIIREGKTTSLLPSTGMLRPMWNFEFDCRHWRRNSSILATTVKPSVGLAWVDLNGDPPISCATPAEHIHNYAISDDGTLLAIITGQPGPVDDDGAVMAPDYKVFLEVREATANCKLLRRLELSFPEQPKRDRPLLAPKHEYWANARLRPDFAKPIAISPDNQTIALGYGIRTGDMYTDSVAHFALYSLETGKRLGAVTADRFKNNLVLAIFKYQDNIETAFAPLGQTLRFTRDGKTLYGSSNRLYRWPIAEFTEP
jgi:hypothetical protein